MYLSFLALALFSVLYWIVWFNILDITWLISVSLKLKILGLPWQSSIKTPHFQLQGMCELDPWSGNWYPTCTAKKKNNLKILGAGSICDFMHHYMPCTLASQI